MDDQQQIKENRMPEVTEGQLTSVLEQFEAAGQTAQAISICSRFLRKREILTQPEEQQSAMVHAAIIRRDRATLRDFSEFSQFSDIRDCSKAVIEQIDAKAVPARKWPSIW
jgi:hypothetical protein